MAKKSRAELALEAQIQKEKEMAASKTTSSSPGMTSSSPKPKISPNDPQADLKAEIQNMDIRDMLERIILQQDTIINNHHHMASDVSVLVENSHPVAQFFKSASDQL